VVAKGSEKRFIEEVPDCKGQPHAMLDGAGQNQGKLLIRL